MIFDDTLTGIANGAAGITRLERDLSINQVRRQMKNVRLFIGFSKKGPFNTVRYIANQREFRDIYGDIDKVLEKKGSFFHRSCLAALTVSPIYCLNILALDDNEDYVAYMPFSTSCGSYHIESDGAIINYQENDCYQRETEPTVAPYIGMFNTDAFWYADGDSFAYNTGVDVATFNDVVSNVMSNNQTKQHLTNDLLNFTNIGKSPVTILVRKSNKFSVADMNITAEEWYGTGNVPTWMHKNSLMSDFFVDVILISGNFGGQFIDANGDANPTPYVRFASDVKYSKYFDQENGLIRRVNYSDGRDTMLDKFLADSEVKVINQYTGSLIPGFVDKLGNMRGIVEQMNRDVDVTNILCYSNTSLFDGVAKIDGAKGGIDLIGHSIIPTLMNGDDATVQFLSYKKDFVSDSDSDTNYYIADRLGSYINKSTDGSSPNMVAYDSLTPADKKEYKLAQRYTLVKIMDTISATVDNDHKNEFYVSSIDNINVGDYVIENVNENDEFAYNVVNDNGVQKDLSQTRLTRVKSITSVGDENTIRYKITCYNEVKIDNGCVTKILPVENYFEYYNLFTLNGFKIEEKHLPNGTNERQNHILRTCLDPEYDHYNTNLFSALTDRMYSKFRWLVDTFGLGIEEECKSVYTKICKKRASALALINAPSMKDFRNSVSPSFTDNRGAVRGQFIAEGGNMKKAPRFLFSLPEEQNGASWGGHFYPYLKVRDNGVEIPVPPAAYVSNLFVLKYKKWKPWSIIAGENRGVINGNGVVGVETILTQEDRNYLEPFGINCIIMQDNVGVEVYANQTAKQTPKSSLSKLHNRECCIYIQDGIEDIVRKYNWETNTEDIRNQVLVEANTFMDTIKNAKPNPGVYDYINVIDETNNTNEVIENDMTIIDTFVEFTRGNEKIVERLTILHKGAIEAGEYQI